MVTVFILCRTAMFTKAILRTIRFIVIITVKNVMTAINIKVRGQTSTENVKIAKGVYIRANILGFRTNHTKAILIIIPCMAGGHIIGRAAGHIKAGGTWAKWFWISPITAKLTTAKSIMMNDKIR